MNDVPALAALVHSLTAENEERAAKMRSRAEDYGTTENGTDHE